MVLTPCSQLHLSMSLVHCVETVELTLSPPLEIDATWHEYLLFVLSFMNCQFQIGETEVQARLQATFISSSAGEIPVTE